MRKLYVPISMDPSHNIDIYDSDFKKLGADMIFLTEPERIVLASKKRYTLILKRIKSTIESYEARGYECGMWISTLGYGGPLYAVNKEMNNFTPIRSITGQEAGDASCPMDKAFTERVCMVIKDLALAGAKTIILDDDLCLSVRPGLGCACDRHIAEFNKRIGNNVSIDELPELLFTGKPNEYRREWLRMQGDTLREFCKALRSALDEVSPETRMGFCAGYSSWDVEGVDAIELSRILAGNTKPFLRLTSAPYWYSRKRFGLTPLSTLIEFTRMQAAWVKGEDIEVFTECDSFPHDRYNTPVSHLQCFDAATMLTKDTGVLKYFYHYPCLPETERGYIDAHLSSQKTCAELQSEFYKRNEIGVRVYERMHKLADATLPRTFDKSTSQKQIMKKFAFSEAQMMLSVNAIPTVYEGKGLCGIAFGENARYLTEDEISSGLIIDIDAAEILIDRGVDVGLRECRPLNLNILEDYGDGLPVSAYWSTDLCDIKTDPRAHIISEFVDTDYLSDSQYRSPSAYLYENRDGQRFLVYAFRAQNQPENSGMYWSYHRGAQIAKAIEWLSEKPLPVNCTGKPFGYCRCNEDEKSVVVAYFNCTSDGIDHLDLTFSRDIKNIRPIVGICKQEGQRSVTFEDIRGYGHIAVEAEYL